jgi:hypothetical protein
MNSYDSVGAMARGIRGNRATPTVVGVRAGTVPHWPDSRAATKLWARLIDLRTDGQPRLVAKVEEALFRFYTPLAHALAEGGGAGENDDRARMLAELGLAKAILVWPLPDGARFEQYARNAIRAEFANHSARNQLTNPLLRRMRAMSARDADDLANRRVRPGS